MLIADTFVFLHIPKTAGTFVTKMLTQLHANIGAPLIDTDGGTHRSKHSWMMDIPEEHKHKKVLVCMRNPFDHYVSHYEFGWWKTSPNTMFDDAAAKKKYSKFPELSFAEFIDIMTDSTCLPEKELRSMFLKQDIGRLTLQYCRYLFASPYEVIEQLDTILSGKTSLPSSDILHAIHAENVNVELYNFLLQEGYKKQDIAFILEESPISPDQQGKKRQQRSFLPYYDDGLRAKILRKDRLLFLMFPEYTALHNEEQLSIKTAKGIH